MHALRARTDIPTLTVCGAGEFAADGVRFGASATNPDETDVVRRAYDRLRMDAGFASGPASRRFRAGGGSLPSGFVEVTAEPVTRYFRRGGFRIAVIFFPGPPARPAEWTPGPSLPGGTPNPAAPVDADLSAAVLEAGRRAGDADLVIGVSPWGIEAESAAASRLNGVFHVLLGAGPGSPFPFHVQEDAPGLVWSRADRRGRSLTVLEFAELPGRAPGHVWIPGLNADGREILLDHTVPEDPDTANLLEVLRPAPDFGAAGK